MLWVIRDHDPLSLERGGIGGRSLQGLGSGNSLELGVTFLELHPYDYPLATPHCIVRLVIEADGLNFGKLFIE